MTQVTQLSWPYELPALSVQRLDQGPAFPYEHSSLCANASTAQSCGIAAFLPQLRTRLRGGDETLALALGLPGHILPHWFSVGNIDIAWSCCYLALRSSESGGSSNLVAGNSQVCGTDATHKKKSTDTY